ncbi:hypothetical protein Plhal304r1_c038g0114121 [Plasmopara halstedii]
MSNKIFYALICSTLSLCGFLFLLLVGILFKLQPEYMKINKNVKSSVPIFESAALYGALFVASSVIYFMESKKTQHKNYDLSSSTSAERMSLLDKPTVSYS